MNSSFGKGDLDDQARDIVHRSRKTILVVVAIVVLIIISSWCIETIPAGHVGVAVLWGKVQPKPYPEGLHFVNPLYRWQVFDARQKTHSEQAAVPSQDQLKTQVDLSVQFRVNAKLAPEIVSETGSLTNLIEVQLKPKVRSLIREQGKTVEKAEEFYLEETQQRLQDTLLEKLNAYLAPKGVVVSAVLIRDISLPKFIDDAIQQKKEREQAAEKQKAELERFKTEQEQKIAEADAELQAAVKKAEMVRTLADAQAYEIQQINEATARSPAYLQLQAMEALKEMSKDPAAKIYFLNGDSPNPLPLMHLGER